MSKFIAQIDTQGNLIRPAASIAVEPEQAAQAMGWQPGTWREITPQEFEELNAPTQQELEEREAAAALAQKQQAAQAFLLELMDAGMPAQQDDFLQGMKEVFLP